MVVTRYILSMQRKSFGKMACPIALQLGACRQVVQHPDYSRRLARLTRFDEFQKSLNIAPIMLTRRLSALVDAGLLERRRYSQRPPRYEYILTEMGRDFRPIIVAMSAWGNRHFAPESASVLLVDKKTQRAADPVLIDERSGRPLNERDFVFAAGPAASERTRRRYAMVDQKKPIARPRTSRLVRGRKRRAS
jgi:DNA-binding HxlR family transcriptional regulator